MQLRVGDKVVHPGHGPGVVVDLCERSWNGARRQFYVVRMMAAKIDVYLPVSETGGLRPVMSHSDVPRLERILGSRPEGLPRKSSARHALIEQQLSHADGYRLAQILRDVAAFIKQHSMLLSRDYELFRRVETLLCAEWALAEDISMAAARARICRALKTDAHYIWQSYFHLEAVADDKVEEETDK